MSKVIQVGDFFVVGGPVPPERACYVKRAADQILRASIRERRFSFVLGPRAIGKSSLMGRTIKALRDSGELAAAIDLAPIDARGESVTADRWTYSIAHRIVHELRLQVDLPSWWREKGALLGEQRLTEFFSEIVLANTAAAVTVFFDEIERTQNLPFASELFAAIDACYVRRNREPDFARLNFVVLGVASVARLLPPRASSSPFPEGQAVELADFDPAQSYQLAIGFGGEPAQTQALMDRVLVWTNGHPYLTQKVSRAVERKGGNLEDVEHAVREQLLAVGAASDEPMLKHIRTVLAERTPRARQAQALLRKVARGAHVRATQPESPALEILRLAGVVSVDTEQRVRYRNRIFKEVFGTRWLKSVRPKGWRIAAAVVLFAVVAAGAGFAYVEYLPRSYLQTLTEGAADFAQVDTAYQKLHGLPGFAERADALFEQALIRRAEQAATLADVTAAGGALRGTLGRADLADRLLQDFWLRETQKAMHAERRDDALLVALQALPREEARAVLAELIGSDYPQLERRFDWLDAPPSWTVDWVQLQAVGINFMHRAARLDLEGAAGLAPPPDDQSPAQPLTVLEYRPIVREIDVAEAGSAGEFELTLSIQHPASGELLLTLTAPSGAQANAVVPQNVQGPFSFPAGQSSPFTELADENREGRWQVALVDRRVDNSGALLGWSLKFGADEEPWRDEPVEIVAIPDPVRTEQVNVEIAANGRFAIATPAQPGPVGALALWNLREDALQSDLQLPAPAQYAELNASSTRLLVVAGDALILWNVPDGVPVARLATQTDFTLPPALAVDGGYVMIAESVEAAAPLFSLLRTDDGELLTSVEGVDGVASWVLGAQARYLLLLDSSGVVRVMNPRRGEQLAPLRHVRAVRRVLALGAADAALTVDAVGDIRVWRVGGAPAPEPRVIGNTVDPASLSVAPNGTRVAYAAAGGQVEVRDVVDARRAQILRIEPAAAPTLTRLSLDGTQLLTATGTAFRLWRFNDGTAIGADVIAQPELSAIALDAQGDRAALGFRGGYVRAVESAELARAPLQTSGLDAIGHRGAVRSLAVNAALGALVSGGTDGTVRAWDMATMQPTDAVMRHADAPVQAVALSNDGRAITSAVGSSVRLWPVADPASSTEIVMDGAAVLALDFSPDDRVLAVGAADGRVQLRNSASGEPAGEPLVLPNPIRWLSFSADGRLLFAATDHWLHALNAAQSRLEVVESRFLASGVVLGSVLADPQRMRLVAGLSTDRLSFPELALNAPAAAPLPVGSAPLLRDWAAVLGMRLDSTGSIVPSAR